MNIDLFFQPKQLQLLNLILNSKYTEIAYGGSSGGAKSNAIRQCSLYLCNFYSNIKIGIFRRTYSALLSNHINKFKTEYPHLQKYFIKSEKSYYLPNGSTIQFCHGESLEYLLKYQGDEFAVIFIDEATHFTQDEIEWLKTRNRSLNPNLRPIIVYTCNPGGRGHSYIKRIFIDRQYLNSENPDDYTFLPAKIYDNVIWSIPELTHQNISIDTYYYKWDDEKRKNFCYKYSDYAKALLNLPKETMLAYLEGDWNIFTGQFFSDWAPNIHIVDKLPCKISDMHLVGGIDYGNTTVLSILGKYNNNIYLIDELFIQNVTKTKKAELCRDFLLNSKYYSDIPIIADSNMFYKSSEDDLYISPSETFSDLGINLIQVSKRKSDNKEFRKFCNDSFKDLLHWDNNTKPKFFVLKDKAPNFCRTLPLLQASHLNPLDIDISTDEDHCFDSVKIAIIQLLPNYTKTNSKDIEKIKELNRQRIT